MKKIAALALVSLFAATSAFAQTPAPAVPAKPAVTAPVAPAAADKQALSKKCSADADAKGLHGKERKKFRDACKSGK